LRLTPFSPALPFISTIGTITKGNIKSVLVKEEEVMPAAIYVIVAGFAGSIVARRRTFKGECFFFFVWIVPSVQLVMDS
jgi:hypothetical protein